MSEEGKANLVPEIEAVHNEIVDVVVRQQVEHSHFRRRVLREKRRDKLSLICVARTRHGMHELRGACMLARAYRQKCSHSARQTGRGAGADLDQNGQRLDDLLLDLAVALLAHDLAEISQNGLFREEAAGTRGRQQTVQPRRAESGLLKEVGVVLIAPDHQLRDGAQTFHNESLILLVHDGVLLQLPVQKPVTNHFESQSEPIRRAYLRFSSENLFLGALGSLANQPFSMAARQSRDSGLCRLLMRTAVIIA